MPSKISNRDNIDASMDGTVMVLRVETDETKVDVQPSASGKTMVIATSGGAIRVNGCSLNMTLYRKP